MRSEEIQQLLQRRVAFDCNRYFREGWNFFKFNCCVLFSVTLTMTVIATVCALVANGAGYAIAKNHNSYEPTPTYYPATTAQPYHYPTYNPLQPNHPEHGVITTSAPDEVSANPTYAPVDEEEAGGDEDYTYYDYYYGSYGGEKHHSRRGKREMCAKAVGAVIGGLIMIVIGYPLLANCFLAVFNAMRANTAVRFGDVFTSLSCARYCRILGLGILLSVLRVLLTLCFIIPGVWFSIASAFAIPVFADRGVGACQSIRISCKIINKHFCSFLGFLILLVLLQFLGTLCMLVGLLVTIPVAFVSFCYCYHHIFGVSGLEHMAGPGDSESDAPIPPVAQPVHVVADPIAPPASPAYNPQPHAPMPYATQPQYPAGSYIPTATPVYPPQQHAYAPYSPHGAPVQMQPVVMHAIPVQFAPNGPYVQPGHQ